MPKLGQKISEGSQHEIYENPDDPSLVLKIPKADNRFTIDIVRNDIRLMAEHFSHWTLPTEVVPENDAYYIVQQRISPIQHLRPSHMTIPEILTTFEEIAEANKRARRDDGVELDFLGTEGTHRALTLGQNETKSELELLNILIDTRNCIKSLCLNGLLFHFRDTTVTEHVNARISTRLHRHFIKKYFSVDIAA